MRFSIGKLVELVYLEAAVALTKMASREKWSPADFNQKFASDPRAMDILRKSLGHPLNYASSVDCIIASVHGLDSESAQERLFVASKLWANKISAEYLPQSGVMISLLKQSRQRGGGLGDHASDWSLDELYGVCAILKIPFVVIVQPHLLRDKGSVRLRSIAFDSFTSGAGSGGNEIFVELDNLASTISSMSSHDNAAVDMSDHHRSVQGTATIETASTGIAKVDCIFVDNDQFFSTDKQVSKSDTSNWKEVMKSLKSVSQKSQAYLEAVYAPSAGTGALPHVALHGTPVFAVHLSFWILREFGTSLMKRGEPTASGASAELTEKYPRHKRLLKTLAMAIDNTMKRNGYWSSGKAAAKKPLLTIFLYSKSDDRFDMVSLDDHSTPGNDSRDSASGRRRAHSGRHFDD